MVIPPKQAIIDAYPTDHDDTTLGSVCASFLKTRLAKRPGAARWHDPRFRKEDRSFRSACDRHRPTQAVPPLPPSSKRSASWSSWEASRILLRLVVEAFAPQGLLVFGVDETLERRWERRILLRASTETRCVHHTTEKGSYFDLLRGEEPYKLRWSSRAVPNRRMVLGRNLLVWSPYAAYHALRSRAKRYAYAENAPAWVKDTKDRYQTFRYAAARYANSESATRWTKRITARNRAA